MGQGPRTPPEPDPGVNGALTPDDQRPPWAYADPEAVIQQLTAQIAGMVRQLAMRDAYIAQLHQALQLAIAEVPQEEHPAGVG